MVKVMSLYIEAVSVRVQCWSQSSEGYGAFKGMYLLNVVSSEKI